MVSLSVERYINNIKYTIEEKLKFRVLFMTLLCRTSNCKLAVQYKIGLQRLAQFGFSNVHCRGALRLYNRFSYSRCTPMYRKCRLLR